MESREDLRERIRAIGLAQGFDKVGFAPARVSREEPRLSAWLSAGMQGDMSWMARRPERRTDAGASLEGARTVICCALNYYQGPTETHPFKGALSPESLGVGPQRHAQGVLSSYARGEDYHRVLQEKLEAFMREIREETGAAAKAYVDTGPLLEKAYAVEAGLGWLGKHGNVLARTGSSWFFLGEILLSIELPPDGAEPNHCGTCTRCMTACPTGAIVEPYVVDSRLCISYLTIELRGPIPRPLRPLIGLRIYGCDDCQDVCPWNRFARKSDEARFLPREPLASMDLVGLLGLSRDDFMAATRTSAIRRARYAGFLRNVAVALGNTKDSRAVPALRAALEHEEPLVRGHAAWALGEIGEGDARARLVSARAKEKDPSVIEEIDEALRRLEDNC